MADYTCFVCGKDARVLGVGESISEPPARSVACEQCGTYAITRTAERELHYYDGDPSDKAMLSALLRERHVQDRPATVVPSSPGAPGAEPNSIRVSDIRGLAPRLVPEKVDRVLRNLAHMTQPGDVMRLDARTDTPLLFATNRAEADSMLRHLVGLELLVKRADFHGGGGDYELTMEARQRVEESEPPQPQSQQGFIAMWFATHLDEAHIQGLRTAIRDAGYEPKRVDDDQFNERIDERIIAGIRESLFLVADVTGHRPAVYFEAGLAMGLGVPVVFTCHRDDLDKCPFDTRQYNHVVWESPEDLREKLTTRIREAILPSERR